MKKIEIMVHSDANDRLVQALSANLTPVRRLTAPALRVLLWLAIVGSVVLALAIVSDVGAMIRRLMAAPDMWVAALSSMLTAVLAAAAAFQLNLPDRRLRGPFCRCRQSCFGLAPAGSGA